MYFCSSHLYVFSVQLYLCAYVYRTYMHMFSKQLSMCDYVFSTQLRVCGLVISMQLYRWGIHLLYELQYIATPPQI